MGITEDIIKRTEKYSAHNYHPLDIVISRGDGIWVWDVEGNKYMDMLSAYSALNQGHRHPKIIKAAIEQLGLLTLTSRAFHNDVMGVLTEYLAKLTNKDKVLLMNTGAEAVETAIKAARKWGYKKKGVAADKAEIIVCSNNFHGRTTTIVGFSSEEQYKDGFGPFTPGFKLIPYNSIEDLEQAINENTVAFLVEPIQGEGGVIVPDEGYLKKAKEITEKNNVLFLADEIQTGFGRTGALFASYHEKVDPDIIVVGKALGGGLYPVSGIIANDNIMDVFTPGDHGSTFGGNPFGAAIAIASLDVILEENLIENARELGKYFTEQLKSIKSDKILQVRGKGLLIGVEIKKEYGTARPYCEALKKEGILAKETHHQVVRFAPPLTINKEEIDWALERIKKVLEK